MDDPAPCLVILKDGGAALRAAQQDPQRWAVIEPVLESLEVVGTPAVQGWVLALGVKKQCALLACVRGPDDGAPEAKELVRRVRSAILVRGDERKPSFFSERLQTLRLEGLEYGSAHVVCHLRKAARILAKHHPAPAVQEHWREVKRSLARLFE